MFADLTPAAWPVRRLRADLALAFGLYAALALACIFVGREPGSIAVIWLANGALAALIVTAPRRHAVPMLGAGVAGNLAANLLYGDPLALSAAFLLPNAAEAALAVSLMRAVGTGPRHAQDAAGFLRTLAAGALLPPLLGATLGATVLERLGFASFSRVWLDWYLGAATGSLALLPLVMELRAGHTRVGHALARPAALFALALLPPLTALALWLLPYPFVFTLLLTLAVALTQPRVVALAAAPLVLGTIALALAFELWRPGVPDTPVGHAGVFIAVLMSLLPAQLMAVVLARQRALDRLVGALASRTDEIALLLDTDGVVRWASRARENYRGMPNTDVLGEPVQALVRRGAMSADAESLFEAALAGRTTDALRDVEYPARGRRTMRLVVQPALDDAGRVVGVLSVATDVTEREAARRTLESLAERLQASNDSLEQFVRIASHDLREPMNTVQQFVQLLQEGAARGLPEPGATYFEQVRRGALRMKTLLDDVLTYTRLDADAAEPGEQAEPVDLDALLAQTVQALDAQLRGCKGSVQAEAPLGRVRGQPSLLALLLQNLISNALKFSRPGVVPDVRVSVHEAGAGWRRLEVRDNGIGIPAERIAELGQPFRRLHARRRYDGTGLGLSICMRIAQRHGGTLEIRSEPGAGSVFGLRLPSDDPPAGG